MLGEVVASAIIIGSSKAQIDPGKVFYLVLPLE
jgi:hypothetical protein